MNYKNIIFNLSVLILVIGTGLAVSAMMGFFFQDAIADQHNMRTSAAFTLFVGLVGFTYGMKRDVLKASSSAVREGFLTVCLGWILASIFGAVPFILCCKISLVDAIFETASGLSTTGATIIDKGLVLTDGTLLSKGLEGLPRCILFWRALLNWMGGIGFVMFALMILPILGGGHQLYNAEVPGLKSAKDMLTSRISTMSTLMLGCYILWTVLVTVAYRFSGMGSWFEAVTHAFPTVATGGFSPHTDSFGYFHSSLLHWEAAVFMLVSSFNLLLMLKLLMKGTFEYHKDEEVRWYCIFALAASLVFACQMCWMASRGTVICLTDGTPVENNFLAMFRTAFFQVVSMMSTTGFTTSDYEAWGLPGLQGIILFLMFCGGCGGSTAGGLKLARLLVVSKQSLGEMKRRLFPHLMPNVQISGTRLEMPVVRQTMAFLFLYIATISCATLLLPFICSMDFGTAFSLSVTAISNVGPGFGGISPANTCAWLSAPAKYLVSFIMIAGRLELYTVFLIFMPSFWHTQKIHIGF